MSQDRVNLPVCPSKVPYASKAAANRAARELKKRNGGFASAAFFCPHCGAFHIGRSGREALAALRRRRRRLAGPPCEGMGA